MNDIFLTRIDIRQIRHLHDIHIPLSETERKHLIITGKNGSGKTSVLEVLRDYLESFTKISLENWNKGERNSGLRFLLKKEELRKQIRDIDIQLLKHQTYKKLKLALGAKKNRAISKIENFIENIQIKSISELNQILTNEYISLHDSFPLELDSETSQLIDIQNNIILDRLKNLFYFHSGYGGCIDEFYDLILSLFTENPTEYILTGKFIIAYFGAKRQININIPQGITKIDQKEKFEISEQAGKEFLQFLVNMKADRSFARDDNNMEIVQKIDEWFELFTTLLAEIFEDTDIKLLFNSKDYSFEIITKDNIALNFTTLSDGYSDIFNLISELMMRMEKHKTKLYDVQGIVLIDEIETHLHIDLQKKILPFLTKVFPKIQFIVTTHSPFVLSSEANTVIFDLEKQILVEDMSGYSLDSIVESYYNSDKYSQILKSKVERYETLFLQPDLTDEEDEELMDLKLYFKDLPQFLSPELSVKLHQLY